MTEAREGEAGPSDEALARRARDGDEDALRVLLERRMPLLRERLRRKLPALVRRKVAESDLIQEAHLTAYQGLGAFEDRGEGSFGRWLDRILEFKLRKAIRHHLGTAKRDAHREVSRGARPDTQALPGREASPSAHAIERETTERVRAAMERLSEDHQGVLRLVREEGLSFAEAGRRMDRSENAAVKLYTRALCQLTKLVEGAGT